MLHWSERVPGPRGSLLRAVTSRSGGSGAGRYAGLNLGDHVGDAPDVVAGHRRALARHLGVAADRLLVARQVHGRDVEVVTGPWDGEPPEADALVTAEPGLVLTVLVADCTPVMLVAPEEGLVGVAHAGRRGLVDGVVGAVVETLRGLGASRIDATVGPSICPRCYEVPSGLREEVAAGNPVSASVTRHGTPALDVAGGVLEQLARAGVRASQLPGCTVEDDGFYSYRRDGTTGRFAGLAWVEPA